LQTILGSDYKLSNGVGLDILPLANYVWQVLATHVSDSATQEPGSNPLPLPWHVILPRLIWYALSRVHEDTEIMCPVPFKPSQHHLPSYTPVVVTIRTDNAEYNETMSDAQTDAESEREKRRRSLSQEQASQKKQKTQQARHHTHTTTEELFLQSLANEKHNYEQFSLALTDNDILTPYKSNTHRSETSINNTRNSKNYYDLDNFSSYLSANSIYRNGNENQDLAVMFLEELERSKVEEDMLMELLHNTRG